MPRPLLSINDECQKIVTIDSAWWENIMSKGKYVIISPCRNEAKFMHRTLNSVINQSIPPALWVIVDDGSTDETAGILCEYAARHSFISIVHRNNRGHRSVGPGVIDAFYAGYETIDPDEFQVHLQA